MTQQTPTTATGTVVSLWRYPVKSMMGEELNSSYITERGLVGDRTYAVVDKQTGKVASAKNPRKWGKLFTKFPKVITHDKRLKDVSRELEYFFQSMLPLKEKTLALVIQLPPSLKITEGIENLRQHIVPELDDRFRYAVEVRDRTRFQDLAYNFFADNNLCMVWSQLAELRTPPIATTDFLYLRFIVDRTIDEKSFGRYKRIELWK
jgi:hypothetical protein